MITTETITCNDCGKTYQADGSPCPHCAQNKETIEYVLAPRSREAAWSRQTPRRETMFVKTVNGAILIFLALILLVILLLVT